MKITPILFSVLVLALPLSAADENQPKRRAAAAAGAPDRPALGAGGANGPTGFERILTDEQRQTMREFIQTQGTTFREGAQKSSQLRRELQEAVFSGKADAKMIKDKTDEIAKLEAEQLRVRTLALSKVAGSFTAEQKEQVKQMSERLRPMRPMQEKAGREGDVPARKGEPAAPPPPEK